MSDPADLFDQQKFHDTFNTEGGYLHVSIRNLFIFSVVITLVVLLTTGSYQAASIAFVSGGIIYTIFSSMSKTYVKATAPQRKSN